ncbi:hypothetical protein L484_015792 [Morus notabilis]|uniref:Uncharacterized protein n=1 Tax=Morus notabilis TaxID=981085 RepID=W9QML6_9ROSA|nr:hypothetical protein L484_015792 [Morus notabilis]
MALYDSKRGLRHSPASIAAIMLVAAVILINANCGGGAAVLMKSNDTYNGCITGREEACLIAEDLELEWLMEYSSHVTRVLAAADPDPATNNAINGGNAACDTGSNGSYTSGTLCRTNANPKHGGRRSVFQRG